MHIAILEAGRTNPDMPAKFRDYPDMFETLFAHQPKSADFRFSIIPVIDDVFPPTVDDFDGYLVTGSAYGVYDNAPFIPRLIVFIQKIFAAGKPFVGICFGHQIVAHALGGHATKFEDGWGIGIFNGITRNTYAEIQDTNTLAIREELVEPITNYNMLVLDKSFNQNSFLTLINTNVTRKENFRNAHVIGALGSITNKKKTHTYDASIKGSLIKHNQKKKTG